MASSHHDDPSDGRSSPKLQREAPKFLLQKHRSLVDDRVLVCQYAKLHRNNAGCHCGLSLPSGNGATPGTASIAMSSARDFSSAPGSDSPSSVFEEKFSSNESSQEIAHMEQSPSKRCKVSRIDDGTDDEDEYRSIFVDAEDSDEENSIFFDYHHKSGDSEEVEDEIKDPFIVKFPDNSGTSVEVGGSGGGDLWIDEDDDEPGGSRETKNSADEDYWIYNVGEAKKHRKTIVQEPKIKKTGRARRSFASSIYEADELKIIMDFNAWRQHEQTRKGGVGNLDPEKIYSILIDSLHTGGDEDEYASHTASQVTLMILSLGSSEAVVELKRVIEEMRCVIQAIMVRPPAKICGRKKNAQNKTKLGKDPQRKIFKEEIAKLTRVVFQSTCKGTPLENFQARYTSTNLCKAISVMRDRRMANVAALKEKNVKKMIYRKLISIAYPNILRYKDKRARRSKIETPQFKDAVNQLKTRSEYGFRWLALRDKFGIGIMALYYFSKLFSETARFSIDDEDITDLEFGLLMSYLRKEGNPESVWLSSLCNLINAHIEQGAEGMLRLPDLLFLEKWDAKQILTCREQSAELLMMCETMKDRMKSAGNKVAKKAWLTVDRNTIRTVWERELERAAARRAQAQKEVEAQRGAWREARREARREAQRKAQRIAP